MTSRPLQSNRDLSVRSRVAVGEYVRELRLAMNLSQQIFGDLIGLGPDVVSKVENAWMTLPTSRAAAYAHHLAVDQQEFALIIFRWHDPHLFSMIFPRATLEPLEVPEADRRRAEAILERRAGWRRRKAELDAGSSG